MEAPGRVPAPPPMSIFNARVRTYDGRLFFHRCVSVQLSGGGGFTPSKVWVGGIPRPRSRGIPHLRSGWGGVLHLRSG